MEILAILCALGAAFTGFIGRMKAAPLVPAYANKFRTIHDTLEPAFWAQTKLARYLCWAVEKHGGIPGTHNAPSIDLHNNLSTTSDMLEKAYKNLTRSDLLDFSEPISKAAESRSWLLLSVGLAFTSAICQLVVLATQCTGKV